MGVKQEMEGSIHVLTNEEENAINSAATECYLNSVEHGFWDNIDRPIDNVRPHNSYVIPTKLMLVVSELAEAMEADRNELDFEEHFGEELADVCIRIFDLATFLQIPIGTHIARKMEVNAGRGRMHGGKRY